MHPSALRAQRSASSVRSGLAVGVAFALTILTAACGHKDFEPLPTLPAVKAFSPAGGASGVHANAVVSVTFNEAMDPASITTTTVTLTQGSTAVPATVTYSGATAILTPTAPLAENTAYTVTVTAKVRGADGEYMARAKTWDFTTGTVPTVVSTAPAGGASGVPLTAAVTATFSMAMDPASISATTFTLRNGLIPVLGTVTVTGATAKFVPSAQLATNTTYTASITTGAVNQEGIALAATYTWTFTTGTLPTVVSKVPAAGATGVSRTSTVVVTFSEAMDQTTLTGANFTVKNGLVAVPGTVTHTATTATFTPTGTLPANTLLTGSVSTGAKNLAGIALGAAVTWTFTTVNTSPTCPALVNLGTAGNFVILAKSGVSTTGATSVVGDIGLSPAAATFMTGFGIVAPPTTSASSALVTGLLYAADYDPPTPTMLTTAVLDMQTAYTDAAGRTLPDFTELGAGNIQGLNLVPGLYKWGTGVSIPSAVTLTGGANDVWIFQVGGNLVVGNGAIVTLAGGAQAKNVFWQVSGQANLGTTADFKGIILSATLISMNTGSTVLGRALAQTAVTLNATAITHP